jgi:hypothetical protein
MEKVLSIGLGDKHGKELFSGAIFKYTKHGRYLYEDFVAVIEFRKGCFGFTLFNGYFTPFCKIDELQTDFLDHIEIIGNIQDNPNLLK